MEQLSDFPLCLFWQEGGDAQQQEEEQKAEPEEPDMWEETFKSYTDSKPFGKLCACMCVCVCVCNEYLLSNYTSLVSHSSGAVWESRWTSWAVRPNEPSGFRGRKDLLNHASALVSVCP